MSAVYTILLFIAGAALIAIVLGLLCMKGKPATDRRVDAEDWDNPFFLVTLVGLAVLAVSSAIAVIMYLWEIDPAHIAAPTLAGLLLVIVAKKVRQVFGLTLASWWSKLVPAPAAVPVKKPWLSKTIALNGLVALGLLAENKLSFLQGVLPPTKYQVVAFILPIANMILRAYTTQGLSLKTLMSSDEANQ
jgi:hypothetical protein